MSQIDNGIKQPLRFWDSVDKQNWRKEWVLTGIQPRFTILNPVNTIIPFQIRRRRNSAVITTFDLYKWDELTETFNFDTDLLTIIPAPLSNHLKIIQMTVADNIIWNPRSSFTISLDCGYYYIHLSDSVNNWYSEVFHVVDTFTVGNTYSRITMNDSTIAGVQSRIVSPGNARITSSKLF